MGKKINKTNKSIKNSTKVPKVIQETDIMRYTELYADDDQSAIYLSVGIKLNLENVPIIAIDPETGLIALTGLEIDKSVTMQERFKIVQDVVNQLRDQILTVTISRLTKGQFEIAKSMNSN